MSVHKNTQGASRVALFLIILLVLGGIGYAAWRLSHVNKKQSVKQEEQAAIKCVSDDQTICKFITRWKPEDSYRFTLEETTDGVTTTTTSDYDLSGPDKIHTKVEGATPSEVISIGDTVYTKAGGTWWKETIKHGSESGGSHGKKDQSDQDFETVKPTQYSRVGKEACGKLQCYKYEVNDPGNADTQQFVWFDDKEYKLRKLTFETADTSSEQTFEYIKVKITAPSPVKDVGPNQKIVPGATGPVSR
jgi:outer membrane lipoprotein-sorting protein